MLATRRCGFSRHRFAPSELLVGGGWWLDLSRLSGKGRLMAMSFVSPSHVLRLAEGLQIS